MVAERISHHDSPRQEEPSSEDDMGDVTPIRSSEGKILLEKIESLQKTVKIVADGVSDLSQGQGRLLGEVSNNASRTQLLTNEVGLLRAAIESFTEVKNRVESMRPKLDSVPQFIEERIVEHDRTTLLTGFLEQKQDRKVLKLEIYKAVIAVVVAGLFGVLCSIGYNALLYTAAHAKPAITHTQP